MKTRHFARTASAALALLLLPVNAFAAEEAPEPNIEHIAPGVKLISNSSFKAVAAVEQDTMVLQGEAGVYNAPLASVVAESIQADWHNTGKDPDAVYFVNPEAADAIESSLETGVIHPMLEPYLEPLDDETGGLAPTKGSCPDQIKTKSKSLNLNFNGWDGSTNIGPFTGTLAVDADITGSATAVLKYRVKRAKIAWWCVPKWVKFEDVRAYGNANVGGDVSLDGDIGNMNNPWKWEKQIAKPFLGSIAFAVGPVPVVIGFKLPIDVGFEAGVSASADMDFSVDGNATGSFDYTCTLNNCSGTSSFSSTFDPGTTQILYGLSGRADVKAWLQVGVRAYLYSEAIAYAQVGVRPKLYGDLWGYYGNNCGDRDHDGINETVDALTLNLDWQVFVTGQAAAFGGTPKKWDSLWQSNRMHIKFWDLIGSDAIEPLLHGAASTPVSTATVYQAQMGSCWPYSDMINYEVTWGDGTSETFTHTPSAWKNLAKTWSSGGTMPVSLKAISDSHGRVFNKTTDRDIDVTTGTGGGGGGGGGGGTTIDPPLASLSCVDAMLADTLDCHAGASGGAAPYTFYWSVEGSKFALGSPIRSFSCSSAGGGGMKAAEDDYYSIRVKARGADGQWSNIATRWCGP